MKGFEAKTKYIKECSFRKLLLDFCRIHFLKLLESPLKEDKKADETDADRLDREFKNKHRLFGNIEFVGELHKRQLITDIVLQTIFNNLLGIGLENDTNVNDNTIEAAIKLISKLGLTL